MELPPTKRQYQLEEELHFCDKFLQNLQLVEAHLLNFRLDKGKSLMV